DTLAVRLIIPLAGLIEDFHLQVIQPPPRVLVQRRLALRAILGAPQKKASHFWKTFWSWCPEPESNSLWLKGRFELMPFHVPYSKKYYLIFAPKRPFSDGVLLQCAWHQLSSSAC
ncbi:hypothetical protein, partial [Endozoicomonas sp. ALB122]|uniref:hypothetical protein n=1 Tax=Endozoicomonas sp. ALB122 TaxID=3403075 RepID=UPI003BB5DEF3